MGHWAPHREHDTVLIIDFGSQYTHLISRRLRELGAYSVIVPDPRALDDAFKEIRPKALILSGGPRSVYDEGSPKAPDWILDAGVPVLGICYGHQLLAMMIGGEVRRGYGEYGRAVVEVVEEDEILRGWRSREQVWMSHGDEVVSLPPSAKVLAYSRTGEGRRIIAAFRLKDRPVFGVQFHPEVSHTPKGTRLLDNFLALAGVRRTWRPENLVDSIVREIRRSVGPREKVLCAVSGGVDSTVTALLTKRAVGDRLVAVFVDHGLFREGEVDEVLGMLRRLGINPIVVDAGQRFRDALRGVRDPEEKRRIIGSLFAEIFRDIVKSDPSIKWLAQGTTYPDVIESGRTPWSDKIKSHHNVAALPSWLGLKLLEPLRYLYKDEVRRLALALGVPREHALRHPFPGPGLAVRVMGEVSDEKLAIARKASRIVEEELRRAGAYYSVWQAFAVVGDDEWVGVKGDSREVGRIVIVRIVESTDGMTADWVRLPHDLLDRIARRIVSEVPGVTMVAYAITTKPPATIEPC